MSLYNYDKNKLWSSDDIKLLMYERQNSKSFVELSNKFKTSAGSVKYQIKETIYNTIKNKEFHNSEQYYIKLNKLVNKYDIKLSDMEDFMRKQNNTDKVLYTNHGKSWSNDDDNTLMELIEKNTSINDISNILYRTNSSIRQRIYLNIYNILEKNPDESITNLCIKYNVNYDTYIKYKEKKDIKKDKRKEKIKDVEKDVDIKDIYNKDIGIKIKSPCNIKIDNLENKIINLEEPITHNQISINDKIINLENKIVKLEELIVNNEISNLTKITYLENRLLELEKKNKN